jgi:hypothetical protein
MFRTAQVRLGSKGHIVMAQVSDKAGITPLQALSDSIASTVEKVGMSTVALRGRGRRALGCGVVWRTGMMVTVAHAFGRVPATVSVITAQQAGADGRPIQFGRRSARAARDPRRPFAGRGSDRQCVRHQSGGGRVADLARRTYGPPDPPGCRPA